MNTQLATVGGKQVALRDESFQHILGGASGWSLLGDRRYVAKKFNVCTETDEKGNLTFSEIVKTVNVDGKPVKQGMPFKEIVALIVESGAGTEAEIKAAKAEYRSGKEAYFSSSTQMAALIGADAALRKTVRPTFGMKGNHTGFTVQARYVTGKASNAKDAKIAELEAKIAAFTLLLPGAAKA